MKCDFCGNTIPAGAIKCDFCGAPVLLPVSERTKSHPEVKKVDRKDFFITPFTITGYKPDQNPTSVAPKTLISTVTLHDIILNIVIPILFYIHTLFSFLLLAKAGRIESVTVLFLIFGVMFLVSYFYMKKKQKIGITILRTTCAVALLYIIAVLFRQPNNIYIKYEFVFILIYSITIFFYYRNNTEVLENESEAVSTTNKFEKDTIETENYLKGIVNYSMNKYLNTYSDALRGKTDSLSYEQLEQIRDSYFSKTTQEILIAAKKNYRGYGFDEKLADIIGSRYSLPIDKYGKDKKYAGYIYAVLCRIYNISCTETLCLAINNKQIRLLNNEVSKLLNRPVVQGAPYEKLLEQRTVPNVQWEDSFGKKILHALGLWELVLLSSSLINNLVMALGIQGLILAIISVGLYYIALAVYFKNAPDDKRSNYIGLGLAVFEYFWFVLIHPNASMSTTSFVMGLCMVATINYWKREKK